MARRSRKRRGLGIRLRNLRIQGKTFEKKLPGNPALEPDFSAHTVFFCLPGSAPERLATLSLPPPVAWNYRLEEVTSWREAAPGLRVAKGLGFSTRIILPCWPGNSCKATEAESCLPKLWECLYVTD